jgi:hypothetical protein
MDRQRKRSDTPLNLLILYDRRSLHVPTIREHLESFARYSRNKIYYVCATFGVTDHEPAICQVDMSIFDAVIIHYSVRLSLTNHLSESFANHLRHYGGFKILFIQDEYDNVNTACDWIKDLGIHLVFSCVPLNFLDRVYPKDKFPLVEFIPTLTGYVPYKAEHFGNLKPHGDRKYLIGYRGRALPYWYGRLGQEKFLIGKTMKDICAARNLCVSIEWDDAKRIYGDAWYQFLGDSKATLGTESGSNVFDFDGDISRAIQEALRINPQLTFNEAYDNFLKSHEGKITMNQISPRIFEAIAMRTGLVLFEGNYSGIIKAGEHFIPLKKDFSNVDEVLSYVQDSRYLEALTNRAYQDIIQSEKYTYNQFIHDFDQIVSTRYRGRKEINCLAMVFGFQIEGQREIYSLGKSNVFSGPVESGSFLPVGSPSKSFSFHKVSTLLLYMWHYLPLRVRQKLKPKIQSIFAKALKRL